jgi:acyl-CoA thioester hydrolase
MRDVIPVDKVGYKSIFKVKQEHIDALNHVNNVVYLQWVQEISADHWSLLASNKIRKNNIWVALRHEIDYVNQSFLNDEISIYTWIDKTNGAKSNRIVQIFCGDKLLTKSNTTWCLLDIITLKPKRIGKEILQLFHK